MPSAARRSSGDFLIATDLVAALNDSVVDLLKSVPHEAVFAALRKWINRETVESVAAPVVELACTLIAALHLFTPGLSGRRPIDRAARLAAERGGVEAKALAALAASRFGVFHVEAFGPQDLALARDCVTGSTFQLVCDGLDESALTAVDVATRLCPVAEGIYWPMGPLVPVGLHGEDRARRFPSRPGKGLINEGAVAAQIYREYVRAGAPFGVDFGLRASRKIILSFVDDELSDYAEAMHGQDGGPAPEGEMLSRLRSLASIPRLAMALNSTVELARGGVDDGAAIFAAAARVLLDVLAERARIGSQVGPRFANLRAEVAACFAPEPAPAGVVALLDALLAEVRPAGAAGETGDETLARVIERIRALRRKTVETGCTEQEALRAAEKVAELLERYGLSLSEVELRKQTCEGFGFDAGRKQSGPLDECFRVVAHFCDCRAWIETSADGGLRHVFFGLPADIEAARCLKDLVAAAFEVETEAFKRGKLYLDEPSSGRKAMTKSFQIGLGGGISKKLLDLKAARDKARSGSTGRDLMIVKQGIVEEEMDKLGLAFRTKTQRRKRVVVDAYEQGVVASHRFEVNEKIK